MRLGVRVRLNCSLDLRGVNADSEIEIRVELGCDVDRLHSSVDQRGHQ